MRVRYLRSHTILMCVMIAVCHSPAVVWSQSEAGSGTLEEVQNASPSFMVRVSVDKPSRTYHDGEVLKLTATSERAGYLYAYYQQADGATYQIYPNKAQPDNRILAKTSIQLPTAEDRFRWVVAPPFGAERIKAVVSTEKLTAADKQDLEASLFSPVGEEDLKGLRTELISKSPAEWAEHSIDVFTLPAPEPPKKKNKRYGVFCGVAQHRYHYIIDAVSEGKEGLNLLGCDRDASVLADLLKSTGNLEEVRVLVNQEATRQNFERAVTQWLPSVSKAGDEVFVFFSGHTGQIPDDGSDEADGQDELLLTHDFAGPAMLGYLFEQQKANKLDQAGIEQFKQLLRLAGIRPGAANQPSDAQITSNIMRATGVSDDALGRWIQTLDGRRVIVILDSCYSAGYAEIEKSFTTTSDPSRVDFLDTEMGRLKDIGQADALLLASSSVKKESRARGDDFPDGRGPFGAMTSYLVEALIRDNNSLSMQQAFEHCQNGLREYFRGAPEDIVHEPFLIGNNGDMIMLRP
ncbi:MAG: DUF4384 domain-containing protein [Planctomycetota bacterium]